MTYISDSHINNTFYLYNETKRNSEFNASVLAFTESQHQMQSNKLNSFTNCVACGIL